MATLDRFRLLGRSGLRVSPLCLGTMTFGTEWGWGADKEESRSVFDGYVEAGGNFIDTADYYTGGTSESWLGEFTQGRRDSLVLATKYTMCTTPGDPNAGGSHRKNLVQSLDASLKRLRTDRIDLLWVHAWDATVPIEETMRALDDVVRAGRVLYVGVSNWPAWTTARASALAELRGWTPLVGNQVQYSLVERSIEREILPVSRELGLGVTPWSPLGGGILSGKYARTGSKAELDQSLRRDSNQRRVNERNLAIVAALEGVAKEVGRSSAQVAIRWLVQKPGVASVILGARTRIQLDDNLQAATFELSPEHMTRLDDAGKIELGYPYDYLRSPTILKFMYGGAQIE
ncbi:MAG TPA: aldo/keto reductase [Candidatus Krumholzibacteria bacterium]|nr:aldo/keto reductase [Candidatus Krumholzibacteria bacterium]